MLTLDSIQKFPPVRPAGLTDFVSSDTAALASHMDMCASTRSRFFGVHAALDFAHGAVCARIVTAVVAGLLLLVAAGMV